MKKIFASILFFCLTNANAAEIQMEDVLFNSKGVNLSGTLVYPEATEIIAAVIFVHGSGKQSRNLYLAERFAEGGIAALVYDKRGVGKSEGEFVGVNSANGHNLKLLAEDALQAFNVIAAHPKLKNIPLGLTGISQAGWIVPIAAEKSFKADFILLWSGAVCKVSEEDIFSKYTADTDSKTVPTYREALQSRKEKYIWGDFLGEDIDPSMSLAKLKIKGLWIFGGQDGSVPVDLSVERLEILKNAGGKYEYVVYPDLGHNNMQDTFDTAVSWIKAFYKHRKTGDE